MLLLYLKASFYEIKCMKVMYSNHNQEYNVANVKTHLRLLNLTNTLAVYTNVPIFSRSSQFILFKLNINK